MKNLRAAIALAFLLACTPAFAQWQTPNHSVPIGKGAGVTGFGSAVPSTTGQPLVSQGPSADPIFGTIANSGIAAGAADTYKGSLNGSTVADVAFPNCQTVSTALRYVPGSGPTCGNVIVQTGFDMPINFGLSVPAPSGGALTITLTQANGSAPTSASPVLVPFRSTALTTGTVTWSTISATQSITIPSGATLGTSNGVPFRLWIFENYNGGTPELGVATCSNATTIFGCSSWEGTLVTSTTISSGATAAGTMYATAGATLDAVRIIGFCEFGSGLTTAGVYASSCTTLQGFGPGIKKPGDTVQRVAASATTATTVTSSTKTQTNTTVSITPTSAANLIKVTANGSALTGSASVPAAQLSRGTTPTLIGSANIGNSSSGNTTTIALSATDKPGVVSSTSYSVFFWNAQGSGTSQWIGTMDSLVTQSDIAAEEIQG